MKKKDLKSGMMVKIDNENHLSLILIGTKDGDVTCNLTPRVVNDFTRHVNYFGLSGYNDDLTSCNSVTGDIIAVYDMYGNILWKKNIVEHTMKDLIDKLGYNFKIVK